jgi:antitoxin (DNA-binding transcriptional repressor) of toxin-antitoxin stability system
VAILSVNQASTNFAKLLERVEAGEEIAIALGLGPPMEVQPLSRRSGKRMPGNRRKVGRWQPSKKLSLPVRGLSPPFFKPE